MTIRQQGGVFGRNPTFNDVTVEGTLTVNGEPISDFGTMAQQDADSVNIDGGAVDGVSLGTNSPVTEAQVDNLNIDGNTISATNTNGGVTVAPNGTGVLNTPSDFRLSGNEKYAYFRSAGGIGSNDRAKIRAVYAGGGSGYGGDLRLSSRQPNNVWNEDALIVRHDGHTQLSGNLMLADGAGIDFSATAGTGTSELFDDYEEGAFTVTSIVPETSGTITPNASFDDLQYTKIGRVVTVTGVLANVTTSSPVGSYCDIGPLPYVVADLSGIQGRAGGACYVDAGGLLVTPVFFNEGATTARFYFDVSTLVSGSSDIYFSISYLTN